MIASSFVRTSATPSHRGLVDSATVRQMTRSLWWLTLGAIVLSSCGSQTITASPSVLSVASSSDATTIDSSVPTPTTVESAVSRHIEHAALAHALPTAAQIAWLPPQASALDDSDLTNRLDVIDCTGNRSLIASRDAAATNRVFDVGQDEVAMVTFYDVETVDGARQYLAAIGARLHCAPSVSSPGVPQLSYKIVDVATPNQCTEATVVRTTQPVSETIDGWCRVGNLIAWFRLYPTGDRAQSATFVSVDGQAVISVASGQPVAPTDAQASQMLTVVGNGLRTAFDAAA